MNHLPCTNFSTTLNVDTSSAFNSLSMHVWLLALCAVPTLMSAGACAEAHGQTAHSSLAQSAVANAVDNLSLPRAITASDRVLGGTLSNGNFGTVNVGSTSPTPISVSFTFDTAKTLGSITVVTQGATGLDFADVGTGTCKAGTAYSAGASCTVDVSFTPKFPGARYGAAKLLDGSGNVLATRYLQGTSVGPQIRFLPGNQSVIASIANGLHVPDGVAVDGSGNVYIADLYNLRVLKETLSAGGYAQSIVADAAHNGLSYPEGVAVDGSGNVYILEGGNDRVLKETLSAGSYAQSVVKDSGLSTPKGVAVDGSGNVYISDGTNPGRVLKETLSAGGYTQSVIADTAHNGLSYPAGVAVDGSGNVYIADSGNNRVLKETLSAGGYSQSVVASFANGLEVPEGIAVDGSDDVYIADLYNFRVLKEAPSAGGYTQGVLADAARNGLSYPEGVAVDGSGNVYIADGEHNRILKEDFSAPPPLTVIAGSATGTDGPSTVTVSNEGNAALKFPVPATGDNPSLTAPFAWDPASTCAQTTASSPAAFELAAGASCTMTFDFNPTKPGSVSGLATLTDNNLNATGAVQEIQLTGVPGSQKINFPPPTPQVVYYGVPPITLSATGGASGNPVIFSIVYGPGSLSGTNNSVLNVIGPGLITIAADQAGNIDYSAAPEVTQGVQVLYSKLAALNSPTPGSTLTGSSATFTWSPGIGPSQYKLYLGPNGVRSNNLYNSGPTTATSVNVTRLPVGGQTIYARLYSLIGGAWHALDYTYTAESMAMLTSPTPKSTLTGSKITFTWSAGSGVTKYELYLGSGVGSDNLYHSGYTTAKSVNVTGLPINGVTIYARLYSYIGGAWQYLDYTYTAE